MNIFTDFAQVVDGLEPVSLRRRDGLTSIAVLAARRLSALSREAEPSGGRVTEANAEWHLQLAEDVALQVGDVVIDENERRWTILSAEELPLLGRWKCSTRELRIAYGCGERVDLERPIWSDAETPEIVGWSHVFTALPVRIQPIEVALDNENTGESVFRIILGESIALEPHDRFVAGDGSIYLLRSYQQAERIDALPVAMVVKQES